MALALNDRVQQTGTANTTVSFTLTGSVPGFQSFAVIGNGNTTYYSAVDANGNWEVGIGTYSTTGPTLTRTTILSSSNSGSAVTFSGSVNVFVTYPSSKSINYDENGVATIGSVLGYSDTGIIGSFASTTAGYNQVIIQNKSSATNASTNFNVSNDTATSTQGYAELGINSSTFSGTGSFNIAGASYLASASTDLTIGTYGAYNVHFVTVNDFTISTSGPASVLMQVSTNGGTSYVTSGYQYALQVGSTSGTFVEGKSTSTGSFVLSYNGITNGANRNHNGYCYIYNAGDSSKYTFATSQAMGIYDTVDQMNFGSHIYPTANTVNAFKIFCTSNTIATADISLYGIRYS